MLEKIGIAQYQIVLHPFLFNLHIVFHVSQLRKYIHDLSHIVQSDIVQINNNLSFKALLKRISNRKNKYLKVNNALGESDLGRTADKSAAWELEEKMKIVYPRQFTMSQSNFKKIIIAKRKRNLTT